MRRPREDKIPNERRPAGQTKEWKSGERETEGAGRRDGREVGRKGRGYGRQHGLKRPVSDPVGGMAIRHSLRGGRRLYLDSARSVPALGDAGHGIACWRAPLAPASANAGQRQGPRCRSCSAHTGLFTAHYPNSALQLSIRPAAPVASYLTHECPPVHSPPLPRPPPALPSDPAICHRAPNSPDSSINHSVSSSGQPHVLILGSLSQGPLPTRRRTRSHPPPWVRHPRAQAPPSPLRL